ncbi:MAG TPA: DcaP family trimeric outer membrane transporter [Saprospiraceae bacterium]
MKRISILLFLLSLTWLQVSGQAIAEPPTEIPPGWWEIPKTSTRLKIGGYVKFDLIHDFSPIASPDYFDVSKIPTDGSEGQSTHLHAKETRIFMDVRTPSKVGELRAYVEGDFYGTNGAFRFRHAFLEIGDTWLAGQWWSNFMDENIIPNTLDFEKPAAYAFARHAMLRWKKSFGEHSYLALALEEPSTNAQQPAEAGKFESPYPDLTARYRITEKWGHIQLSAFAAQLRYRYDTGDNADINLFGGNLSGQLNFGKRDYFIYQVVYGPGAGRYRGGLSAGLDANGDLEALTGLGATAGLYHAWSDKFSSLAVYNQGSEDNTAGQPLNDVSNVSYLAVNLLWHFTEKAFAGIEYLHGLREDISGADGTADRIQFSMKYSFN